MPVQGYNGQVRQNELTKAFQVTPESITDLLNKKVTYLEAFKNTFTSDNSLKTAGKIGGLVVASLLTVGIGLVGALAYVGHQQHARNTARSFMREPKDFTAAAHALTSFKGLGYQEKDFSVEHDALKTGNPQFQCKLQPGVADLQQDEEKRLITATQKAKSQLDRIDAEIDKIAKTPEQRRALYAAVLTNAATTKCVSVFGTNKTKQEGLKDIDAWNFALEHMRKRCVDSSVPVVAKEIAKAFEPAKKITTVEELEAFSEHLKSLNTKIHLKASQMVVIEGGKAKDSKAVKAKATEVREAVVKELGSRFDAQIATAEKMSLELETPKKQEEDFLKESKTLLKDLTGSGVKSIQNFEHATRVLNSKAAEATFAKQFDGSDALSKEARAELEDVNETVPANMKKAISFLQNRNKQYQAFVESRMEKAALQRSYAQSLLEFQGLSKKEVNERIEKMRAEVNSKKETVTVSLDELRKIGGILIGNGKEGKGSPRLYSVFNESLSENEFDALSKALQNTHSMKSFEMLAAAKLQSAKDAVAEADAKYNNEWKNCGYGATLIASKRTDAFNKAEKALRKAVEELVEAESDANYKYFNNRSVDGNDGFAEEVHAKLCDEASRYVLREGPFLTALRKAFSEAKFEENDETASLVSAATSDADAADKSDTASQASVGTVDGTEDATKAADQAALAALKATEPKKGWLSFWKKDHSDKAATASQPPAGTVGGTEDTEATEPKKGWSLPEFSMSFFGKSAEAKNEAATVTAM